MPRKAQVPTPPIGRIAPPRRGIAVRLDLLPEDHLRLDRQARKRGLTKASYVRMILLERLAADEGG